MTRRAIRVLVDLSHLHPAGVSGGIKPALLEMLHWLAARPASALEFVHVVTPGFEAEIGALLRPVDRIIPAGPVPRDLAGREACDVVYCPFGSTALACPGIPVVTLVVDLLHRDFPASIPADEIRMREAWFAGALAATDLFQVISDYTGGQLARHYGVEPRRMVRTYLPLQGRIGASHATRPDPYFYYPANAWAHKNHATLLRAYADYQRRAGPAAWRLVLTGADDERMARVRELAETLHVAAQVDFLGHVSDARVAELWARAGALVFPSLHEGFGIPLVEAMAHGVPILASRATAIPEVTGPAALLVDGTNPAQLAAGLDRIAGDPALRRELAARGRTRMQAFSVETEFGKLEQALLAVAAQPAVWRHTGYHAVDGLTDPEAVFALPRPLQDGTLQVALRPLGEPRTVQFWSGPDLVGEATVPAADPVEFAFHFTPRSAALGVRVTDARKLSPVDPRTHGVLIHSLTWVGSEQTSELCPR